MSDNGSTRSGEKTGAGPNDRPRNETIGQTGAGIPDDTSRPVEVDEAEIGRVRTKLLGEGPQAGSTGGQPAQPGGQANDNPDEVTPGTPLAAENLCRHCGGTGKADGGSCEACGGTGVVLTPVGGGG